MDEAALDAATAEFRSDPARSWTKQKAGLEEVFIHLMATSQDNFAGSKSASRAA